MSPLAKVSSYPQCADSAEMQRYPKRPPELQVEHAVITPTGSVYNHILSGSCPSSPTFTLKCEPQESVLVGKSHTSLMT